MKIKTIQEERKTPILPSKADTAPCGVVQIVRPARAISKANRKNGNLGIKPYNIGNKAKINITNKKLKHDIQNTTSKSDIWNTPNKQLKIDDLFTTKPQPDAGLSLTIYRNKMHFTSINTR